VANGTYHSLTVKNTRSDNQPNIEAGLTLFSFFFFRLMEDQERVIQNALLVQLFSEPIHAFLVS
jgi:hypothetical protein